MGYCCSLILAVLADKTNEITAIPEVIKRLDLKNVICTLDALNTQQDDVKEIIRVNKRRWEIEESFRILKTEFKARPVYLKRDDRIKAHFSICFLSLLIYRILENRLEYKLEKKDFKTLL